MTEAKYAAEVSVILRDDWTDFVPSYHSYYDSYMKIKKLRRTAARQRRIFAAVLICAAVLALFSVTGRGSEAQCGTHVVSRGETLWSIAKEYKSENETMDEYLYKLRKANSMENSALKAGESLIIPE